MRRNYKEFTVFVYNLPHNLDQYGLKGVFQKAGVVSDSYIPHRRPGRNAHRFGFVRFRSHTEAIRSISMLNNAVIRRQRIKVSLAKFGKTGRKEEIGRYGHTINHSQQQGKKVWKRKVLSNPNLVRINQGNTIEAFKVIGNKSNEAVEWLQRSIVCESEKPTNVNTLTKALILKANKQIQIRMLSCCKFLITLPSTTLMEDCLRNHEELDKWFKHTEKWSLSEQADSRRVWLEVFGVPPHGWTEDNFRKIAEVWGRLICLDQLADKTENFESVKMFIVTYQLHRIKADVLLQIDDAGYRVVVSEMGTFVQNAQPCIKSTNKEDHGEEAIHDNLSNDKQGNTQKSNNSEFPNANKMPDMEEVVQETDEAERNSKLDPNQEMGAAAQEVRAFQNSNMEPNRGPLRTSPAGSDHSTTRTRSACSSQNMCSGEFFSIKKTQAHFTSAVNAMATIAQENEKAMSEEGGQHGLGTSENSSPSGPPPGFELGTSNNMVVPNSPDRNETSPQDLDKFVKLAKESI